MSLLTLLLAGCSSEATRERSNLRLAHVSETGGDTAAYLARGAAPAPAPLTQARPEPDPAGGWSAAARPGRIPAPQRAVRPKLHRFAAMPRFKPHAPHVRFDEQACIQAGYIQPTRFVRPAAPVGRGICRVENPFLVTAAASGSVTFSPPGKVRCQMVPSINAWIRDVLQPGAQSYLGSRVTGVRIAASYACRTRNSRRGARISEHARGNAIDISEFHLADGRIIKVKDDWRGPRDVGRFLRYAHRGACEHFSTVLGPNADRYHSDHFHLDLARHGRRGTYRVCR